MKFAKLAVAALALSAAPALANPQVVSGAEVYGPQGGVVGTIVKVDGGQAVLDTGKHKVPLPLASYGKGETGPTITVTKVQLDGMVDAQLAEAAAKRDAALIVGAAVMSADHKPLGTIASIDGDSVVVARSGEAGKKFTLQRGHFDASDHGLMARLTLAQVEEALANVAAARAEGEAAAAVEADATAG